ncbi:MAG: helix-turn-helix transcriptional regulator [Rhodobacteraceae bacterium]|nr:helix-turn-helix transcriptional regulator [Paracoccaceae bacterium]
MDELQNDYLTTRELADLLRIKERKVYDLAANGEVPCVRVVGKLLFPRQDILDWMEAARSGPAPAELPPLVIAGSHDPLLDWALRESGCGLAALFDGSFDGLERMARNEATAAALHIREGDGWNAGTVAEEMAGKPVVLIELARRARGLIVAPGNPLGIGSIADLNGRSFANRQEAAASERLFRDLAQEAGIATRDDPAAPARTEDDAALRVLDGGAEAAFGLASSARRFRLDFVPVLEERFDLLVWRRAFFEPPMQTLLAFLHGAAFAEKARTMEGYDIAGLGRVRFNAAA